MSTFTKVLGSIGHFFKTIFDDGKTLVEKLPTYIKVADDVAADAPTVVDDVTALAVAVEEAALPLETLAAAIAANGTNIGADITLAEAEYKNFPAAYANVKAKFTALLTTLGADEKTIAALFTAPPAEDPAQTAAE